MWSGRPLLYLVSDASPLVCQKNAVNLAYFTYLLFLLAFAQWYVLGRAKIFGATCLTQDSISMVRSTSGSSFRRLAPKPKWGQRFFSM